MEPRTLIKNIFGKERGIAKGDIDKIIKTPVKETSFLEYKRIESLKSNQNPESIARKIIMQELVAFLNKIDQEGGILILGIDAKKAIPTEIVGIENKFIPNEIKLRDWITNDIHSVPHFLEFPSIEIEFIDFRDDKRILLIEIHPKDLNVVYFSRIDNSAYKREADSTRIISLEETVRLIENKKIAKLFITLETKQPIIEEDYAKYRIKMVFNNNGNMPAFRTEATFLFGLTKNEQNFRNVEISFSASSLFQNVSHLNACLKAYQKYFEKPFYPGRPTVIGFFDLKFERECPLQLSVEIDEERGRTKQVFVFTETGVREEVKTFNCYI